MGENSITELLNIEESFSKVISILEKDRQKLRKKILVKQILNKLNGEAYGKRRT